MKVILAYSATDGQNARVLADASSDVQCIKRIDNALPVPAADMVVHFRCFAGCMADPRLNVLKVGALFQEVGGETVPQGMHGGGLGNIRKKEGAASRGDNPFKHRRTLLKRPGGRPPFPWGRRRSP